MAEEKDEGQWKIKIHDSDGKENEHKESVEEGDIIQQVMNLSFEETVKEVIRLSQVEDPEKTPFKSKYKARAVLEKLRDDYTQKETETEGKNEEVGMRLGLIFHLLGDNYIATDEISLGEVQLMKAVTRLSSKPHNNALALIDVENNLGIVWSNRSDFDRASQHLLSAQAVYTKVQALKQDANPPAVLTDPVLNAQLESKFTMTLVYLSQVYSNLKDPQQSANYCQMALNRQLESKEPLASDWIQNCVSLVMFYTSQKNLRQALYCLNAAEAQLKLKTHEHQNEIHETTKANLARAKGHFYLKYLEFSQQQLEKKQSPQVQQDVKLVTFPSLNVPEPGPCPLATNLQQAQAIFQSGLAAFTEASEFYVIDGYVTEHIENQQDISALYKSLTAFENDVSRKCSMHKRRLTKLEPLLEELNKSAYFDFYQQLSDEIAHTYTDLVELKLVMNQQEAAKKATMSSINKLNDLALKALAYYENWLKTFETNGQEPATLNESYHRAYLSNLLAIARLHSKMFSLDPKVTCSYLDKSLEGYKKVIETAQRFQATCFNEELETCKQMLETLPTKINQVKTTGISFQE